MGSKSNWFANKIVNLLRGSSISAITGYVALYTSAPSDSAPGTEVVGGGYLRVAVTFDEIDSVTIGNSSLIEFPEPTGDWGDIVGWGLHDALSGGNYLIFGDQTPTKTVNTGTPVKYEIGELTYSED